MSKQEKIVCPAVKFIFPNNGEKDEVVVPYVKNHKEEYHVFLLLTKLGVWRSTRYREELGFATSFQRFVDPVEAMRISVNNKNRIDYEISGEMDRLRKDLAKATASRNRGTIGVEVGLKLLEDKYFGLESVLNEFRGRNHLKPEDLY